MIGNVGNRTQLSVYSNLLIAFRLVVVVVAVLLLLLLHLISNIEKAQKQATQAVQKQRTSLASQVPLDSLNSHEACTSGQPLQSKPASKETKSHQRSASLNRKTPETDVCSG